MAPDKTYYYRRSFWPPANPAPTRSQVQNLSSKLEDESSISFTIFVTDVTYLSRLRSCQASKSRSPAPPSPSPVPASCSPHPFLPPSHYAAAAGVAYPPPSSTPKRDGSQNLPDHPTFSPPIAQQSLTRTPLSHAESDSSFEFKPPGDIRYCHLDANHQLLLSRRNSHLGNLPQLEAQLLPSLRDTIDRMTRTPCSTPAKTLSPPRLDINDFPSGSLGLSPSLSPPSSSSSSATYSSTSLSSNYRFQSQPLQRRSSSSSARPDPTTFVVPSTPKTKTPTLLTPRLGTTPNQQPALKSGLRPPTPSRHLDSSEGSVVGRSGTTSQVLPRATCADGEGGRGRKDLGHRDTLRAIKEQRSANVAHRPQGRSRSRTDPGATSVSPHLFHPAFPSSPDPARDGLPSHIPRPKTPTHAPPYVAHRQEEGFKAGHTHRTGRKLVLTNAPLVSYSSEESTSEEDGPVRVARDTVIKASNGGDRGSKASSVASRTGKRTAPTQFAVVREPQSRIGLGLEFVGQIADEAPSTSSKYEAIRDSTIRRREALLGIVNDLELGLRKSIENDQERDDDSDYCGEEGLAISVSGDVAGSRAVYGNDDPSAPHEWDAFGRGNAADNCKEPSPPRKDGSIGGHGSDGRNDKRTGGRIGISRRSSSSGPWSRCLPGGPQDNADRQSSASQHRDSQRRDPSTVTSPRHSLHRSRSDAAFVIEDSFAAAARERKALGIAPSSSDYFTGGSQDSGDYAKLGNLAHDESDLSSVGSLLSNEDVVGGGGLSQGAESLFDRLRSKTLSQGGGNRRYSKPSRGEEVAQCSRRPVHLGGKYDLEQQHFRQGSRRASAASVYEDEDVHGLRSRAHSVSDETVDKQRGVVSQKARSSPLERCVIVDPDAVVETKRQEVIRQLQITETAFVDRLHCIIQLFIVPLRVRNSRSWISGVPGQVARLFDWLEDIVNLHTHLLSVLDRMLSSRQKILANPAGELRFIVPRFEVYQPYLVRLEEVGRIISTLLKDDSSDFGEFVRIQENEPICDGWDLERFLVEPVNRLAKYPQFFRELLSATPKTHSDYLSTVSLLYSMEMTIRVMTEVKRREDEYQSVKDISARIRGLPSAHLARRERRLLSQGLMHIEIAGSDMRTPQLGRGEDFSQDRRANVSSRGSNGVQRGRLLEAINEWDGRRKRSGSVKSEASSMLSFKSHEASSSTSSEFPRTPSSEGCSSSLDASHASGGWPRDEFSSQRHGHVETHQRQIPSGGRPTSQSIVNVFVFNDLIVLATPATNADEGNRTQEWNLLPRTGVSKVLGVCEITQNDRVLIALDLLPVNLDTEHGSDPFVAPAVTTIHLSPLAAPSNDSASTGQPNADPAAWQHWMRMFHHSSLSTLRALSFPTQSGRYLIHGADLDVDCDIQKSVTSILASGLPLPKSPSIQLEETASGKQNDPKQQEREERGWWSLRFQQVSRELQREDVVVTSSL